jgi:hypothetical protein
VVFGVPWIQHSLNTVSTDDAYVNSYVSWPKVLRAAKTYGSVFYDKSPPSMARGKQFFVATSGSINAISVKR